MKHEIPAHYIPDEEVVIGTGPKETARENGHRPVDRDRYPFEYLECAGCGADMNHMKRFECRPGSITAVEKHE